MAQQVCLGATLTCTFGAAPSQLTVSPKNQVNTGNMAAATIIDHIPQTNVMSFGMCSAPTNPVVIAATAAKLGVFTPAPCIPATVSPWLPGSPTVFIGGQPALTNSCQLMCTWLGVIAVSNPGQQTVMTA